MVATRIDRAVGMCSRRRVRGPFNARARLVVVCEAAALTFAPVLVPAPVLTAAEASPASCASTGMGSLCNQTDNAGLHVGEVVASLSGLGTPTGEHWICNKELRIRGTLADGRSYERSAVAQCGWDRVSVRFSVDQDFRNHDFVCVAVREHGPQNPWEPDEACTRIKR